MVPSEVPKTGREPLLKIITADPPAMSRRFESVRRDALSCAFALAASK